MSYQSNVEVTVAWRHSKFLLTQFDISSFCKKNVGTLRKNKVTCFNKTSGT